MDSYSADSQSPSWGVGSPSEMGSPCSEAFVYSFRSMNDLSVELSSLQELAIRGSWRSILDKVARARSLSLLLHPHDHLVYLSYKVLSLFKLRRFSEASSELESVDDLDNPHYLYESYPLIYPNRKGSMLPFSLRCLHSLVRLRVGRRLDGLDRLYSLLHLVRNKISHSHSHSLSVWTRRELFVIYILISQHLINKEYTVCLAFITDLLSRPTPALNPILLSNLGYIQMQIGDLDGANASFDRVQAFLHLHTQHSLSHIHLRNLISRNKALVFLVRKDYVSAVREYQDCIDRDDTDAVAINNKAICLMYLRDLSDSIKVLENALERVTTVALNETLVVNLCSMYELAFLNHSDIKRTLSNWIARVAPDDFDSSCTRI